jgi:hypothetical protein
MYVVAHEGRVPTVDVGSLTRWLGPDGELASERRLVPGYLGSLLLVGERSAGSDEGFLLLEMWDDRAGPPSGEGSPAGGAPVAWTSRPRVYVAVR